MEPIRATTILAVRNPAGGGAIGGDGQVSLCPESWLPPGTGHDEVRAALQPLLELDVRYLLVSHGAPVLEGAAAALRSALVSPRGSRRP